MSEHKLPPSPHLLCSVPLVHNGVGGPVIGRCIMLNDFQKQKAWDYMLQAETRALYFGDLASRYTTRKQWITGSTFFLSSGAAATLIGKSPTWVPLLLAVVTALLTAYAMAVNLDGKINTMAKLHSSWNLIKNEYSRLWARTYADDAEATLDRIAVMEVEPSELATTDAPNNQKLLGVWQGRVFTQHGVGNHA